MAAFNENAELLRMVTARVAFAAHCPTAGVKVYGPELVLLIEVGNQVPFTPLLETLGSEGTGAPWHNGAMGSNTGIVLAGFTVTSIVIGRAH